MVQPCEVAHMLGRKRDVPSVAGSPEGTGGLDKEVAHQPTDWVAAARRDRGTDRVVVGPGHEGDLTAWTLRSRGAIAPMFLQQMASVQVLDPGATPVKDRCQWTTLVEAAQRSA